MDYMSVEEAAQKWILAHMSIVLWARRSPRRFCAAGRSAIKPRMGENSCACD